MSSIIPHEIVWTSPLTHARTSVRLYACKKWHIEIGSSPPKIFCQTYRRKNKLVFSSVPILLSLAQLSPSLLNFATKGLLTKHFHFCITASNILHLVSNPLVNSSLVMKVKVKVKQNSLVQVMKNHQWKWKLWKWNRKYMEEGKSQRSK